MQTTEVETWEAAGLIVQETDKAILFDDGRHEAWLPRSRIEIIPTKHGGAVIVVMPEWLAKNKGLL